MALRSTGGQFDSSSFEEASSIAQPARGAAQPLECGLDAFTAFLQWAGWTMGDMKGAAELDGLIAL